MKYLDKQIDQGAVIIINDFIEKYLLEQRQFFAGDLDAERKIRHTHSCCEIFDILSSDYEESERGLVRVAVKAHDIGRFMQLRMIGSYDDSLDARSIQFDTKKSFSSLDASSIYSY